MIGWEDCPAVESVPGKMSGAWVFRGARVPLWSPFGNIGEINVAEFCEWYPHISRERVEAVLDFLAEAHKVKLDLKLDY